MGDPLCCVGVPHGNGGGTELVFRPDGQASIHGIGCPPAFALAASAAVFATRLRRWRRTSERGKKMCDISYIMCVVYKTHNNIYIYNIKHIYRVC